MAISNPILDLLGKSPILPMQNHMDKVHECVLQLTPFMQAINNKDWPKVNEIQQKIARLEGDADDLKRKLRLQLPKGLFLPVARTDLLNLLNRQDKLANKAKDISGLMTGRQMLIPESVQEDLNIYLQRCIDASAQAKKAIGELGELLATSFKGREASLVENMIIELDKIENETDKMQIKVRKKIFDMEAELPAIDAIFLYKIVEWIGDLADRAQLIGARLELLLAK